MDKFLAPRIIGAGMGLVALFTGGKAVWQGAAGKLGEAAAGLDPSILQALDSDFRYFAGIWLFTGVVYLVGVATAKKVPQILQIAFELTVIGGIARAFAFTEYGFNSAFLPAILIEIIPPVVGFALLKIASRQSTKVHADE